VQFQRSPDCGGFLPTGMNRSGGVVVADGVRCFPSRGGATRGIQLTPPDASYSWVQIDDDDDRPRPKSKGPDFRKLYADSAAYALNDAA